MKLTKVFFFIPILFIFSIIPSKGQSLYSNYVLNPLNNWSGGTAIFSKDDITFFSSIGGGDNSFTDKAILIGQLDSNGEIKNKKIFTDSYTKLYPAAFYPIGDSLSIVIGSKVTTKHEGLIYQLDMNFDTIFTKFFMVDTFQTILRSIDILPNSEYIMCGDIFHYLNPWQGISDGIFLYKTDSFFNIQWVQTYKYDVNNLCFTVNQTSDNGFVIGGYTNAKTDYSGQPLVIKTDSLGNQQWIWQEGSQYDDFQAIACNTLDNNILISYGYGVYQPPPYPVPGPLTKIRVVKMNYSGNTIWTKDYGNPTLEAQAWSILPLPDSSYVIGGIEWSEDSTYTRSFLLKINKYGDSLWMRHYIYESGIGIPIHNELSQVSSGPDNTILVIGYVFAPNNPQVGQSTWIMRLDSLGCDTPECNPFVGVKKPGIMKEGNIRIFPNPANQYIEITIPEGKISGNITNPIARFYDLNGKLVQESIPEYQGNSYICDTHTLKQGIYFVQLIDRNCILGSGKLLIAR